VIIDWTKYPNYIQFESELQRQEQRQANDMRIAEILLEAGIREEYVVNWLNWRASRP
jgi:hypothetical protein